MNTSLYEICIVDKSKYIIYREKKVAYSNTILRSNED